MTIVKFGKFDMLLNNEKYKHENSEELMETSNKMIRGTFLNSNKTKHIILNWVKLRKKTAHGFREWWYNLVLSVDGNKKSWQPKSISSTTLVLVLVKNNTEETWTFSTTL